MLHLLQIENIAVIEQAQICFDRGFNVLTGETGAGKSIVIDAISAILGERTYRDVIRTGSTKAYVGAVFLNIPRLDWFEENNVPYDPSELLVQREIFTDGRNVCRVNGRNVTVALLKKLGYNLVSIHGQHDSQQLFDESSHIRYLDLFARNSEAYAVYSDCYSKMASVRDEIHRLSMNEAEKLRRMESLRYQIDEIERASLKPDEDETLESRRKVLQNSEKLVDGLEKAYYSISGDENKDGAADLLRDTVNALSRISRFDDGIAELCSRIEDLMYSVDDAADGLRSYMDDLSYSGDELEQIESRLDVLHRLRRKYGASINDVINYMQQAKQELTEIELSDERIETLTKQLVILEAEAESAGMKLRETRKTAADALQSRLSEELAALDMPRAQFVCQFETQPLSPDGMDIVRFLMTANVGEALKPMSKVASGGELARIMLAIKNVLAEQEMVETLIFDEVDSGVSGRAAQKVAVKLRSVSSGKQVLCVTHLPQIAAMADHHLLISKSERDGRTYTSVTPLDHEGRKREIARIIGGAEITDITLRNAEEMLAY